MFQHSSIPIVNVATQESGFNFPCVRTDNRAIGRMGAEELISRGFQHLGFYAVELRAAVVRERMEGFRMAVEKAGRTFHLVDYTGQWSRRNAALNRLSWLGKQLEGLPKPIAMMAQYDLEATDLVVVGLERGLKIPEQLAVIGADNDLIYCELGHIPLSSVDTNLDFLGYKAAELLDSLMAGKAAPREPILVSPSGVVVRRSSDIFATEDPALRKALAFIGERLGGPLSVNDVVTVSGASRRVLYRRFHDQIGHTIEQEIARQRFNKAKKMLRETECKLQEIAENCGFEDADQFSKTFKYHVGVAPKVFRDNHRL